MVQAVFKFGTKTAFFFLMRNLIIRHEGSQIMDGRPILSLPQRHEHSTTIHFPADQRPAYDEMSQVVSERFQALIAAQGGQGSARRNMLLLMSQLTPLRQACSGGPPLPLPGFHAAQVPTQELSSLKSMPQAEADLNGQQCPICLDEYEDPVLTRCKHVFCYPCISVRQVEVAQAGLGLTVCCGLGPAVGCHSRRCCGVPTVPTGHQDPSA